MNKKEKELQENLAKALDELEIKKNELIKKQSELEMYTERLKSFTRRWISRKSII